MPRFVDGGNIFQLALASAFRSNKAFILGATINALAWSSAVHVPVCLARTIVAKPASAKRPSANSYLIFSLLTKLQLLFGLRWLKNT